MVVQYDRKVIIFYGLSGHGEGLVNAMSAFGMKAPFLKAVLTNDFKYNSAKDIYQYMKEFFKGDSQKIYFHVPVEETVNRRCKEIKPFPILGCVKKSHHICFKSYGTILTKFNVCFSSDCLEGNILDYCVKKGRLVMDGDKTKEDDYSADSEVYYQYDESQDIVDDETDLYELRSDAVVQVVQPGNVIALFSPPNALELFYLCKVVESGIAKQDIYDTQNHVIKEGCSYLSVCYYEKKPNSEFSKKAHHL